MDSSSGDGPSIRPIGLTDPLAPLLRPAPIPPSPLLLSSTELRLRLVPPVARLIVERRFSNTEAVPIEAVLTYPPTIDRKILHGVAIGIGDRIWRARAQARRRAENNYDTAAVDGHRAILIERLKDDWRTLSIAGIQPGEHVMVRTESVVALPTGMTVLTLRPGADPDRAVPALPDHLSPRLTDISHKVTLIVEAEPNIDVRVDGHAVPRSTVIAVDAGPIAIAVDVPTNIGRLIAPEDEAAEVALEAARKIAAFGRPPIDPAHRDEIRSLALSANLMTAETSLVFSGPDGEASGILPAMRKVALVAASRPLPIPAAPAPEGPADTSVAPDLSPDDDHIVGRPRPGRSGRSVWRWPLFARQTAPLLARWRNWLENRGRPPAREPELSDLGRLLIRSAQTVTWRPDGLLALRSGDPAHLSERAAALMREVARCAPVRDTAYGLHLSPEHISIALLAIAAGPTEAVAVHGLGELFPEDRGQLKPVMRTLARQFGLQC
ncbi:VIT domain-containing protein [Rhodopseudomonas sp. B29]|uniref:VIT domain-containing protein n=1 Tax=Rhodopseudomonas sp. B29 TaxID=95607 RepID=UPI0003473354|nr:VIT domain-containing protein [Rhodopseudomonas sp. B29]